MQKCDPVLFSVCGLDPSKSTDVITSERPLRNAALFDATESPITDIGDETLDVGRWTTTPTVEVISPAICLLPSVLRSHFTSVARMWTRGSSVQARKAMQHNSPTCCIPDVVDIAGALALELLAQNIELFHAQRVDVRFHHVVGAREGLKKYHLLRGAYTP